MNGWSLEVPTFKIKQLKKKVVKMAIIFFTTVRVQDTLLESYQYTQYIVNCLCVANKYLVSQTLMSSFIVV
jgi:hypothetical protein